MFNPYKNISLIPLLVFLAGFPTGTAHAQTKGGKGTPFNTETSRLRADVTRLRAELDAAQRDIRALKAALAGKLPDRADEGPLYRGRPASSWVEQFNDLDAKTAMEAAEPLARFAQKDKKLIAMLVEALKDETDHARADRASVALGSAGPVALPALIEIAKDKAHPRPRVQAIYALGRMGENAKAAVPVLLPNLRKQADLGLLRTTMTALRMIGPAAKDAIPSLVDVLGDSLVDLGKPQTNDTRFGMSSSAINYVALDALFAIDPDLQSHVQRPRIASSGFFGADKGWGGIGGGKGKKGGGGGGPARTPEQTLAELRTTWDGLHATLVKRYAKRP